MSLFDNIGKKISQTSQNLITKVNEMADISKLNTLLEEDEKHLQALYLQLGQLYFEKYGHQPESELTDLCNQINDTNERMVGLQKQLIAARKVRVCPNCGTECDPSMPFCGACGTQLPKEELSTKFCTNCGQQIPAQAAFCPYCGNKG